MTDYVLKSSISEDDFMFHIINNLPDEYGTVLVGLENHLTPFDHDALTINVIYKNVSHQYKKLRIKVKRENKRKQYKGLCSKCGKYGHGPTDQKCVKNNSEDKNEKERKRCEQ